MTDLWSGTCHVLRLCSCVVNRMIMDLLFCLLQLIGMSKYMGLNHFGTDSLLRFQLRNKIRQIKQDDQMILWEGIDSLTPEELRNACAERGMRATGLKQVRCFARLCSSRRRRGGRRSRSSSSLFHFPCHPLPHSCFFGCVFVCVPCARDAPHCRLATAGNCSSGWT